MYVCVCNAITEEKLKSVADQGLTGKDALKHLGVGSGCGVCILEALENLTKTPSHAHSSSESVKTALAGK